MASGLLLSSCAEDCSEESICCGFGRPCGSMRLMFWCKSLLSVALEEYELRLGKRRKFKENAKWG